MRVLHTALLSNFKSGIGIINQMYDELESAKLLLLDSGYLVDDGKIRITWAGHSLLEELRG